MEQTQTIINQELQYKHNPRKITGSDLERLSDDLLKFGDLGGVVFCRNNMAYVGGNQRSKVFHSAPVTILQKFDTPQPDKTVAFGFIEWNGNKYLYREVNFTEEEFREACIVANNDGGEWDWETHAEEWNKLELESFGLDLSEFEHLFPSDEEENMKLANEEFEPTTGLNYVKFAGYKIPLSDFEFEKLNERIIEYFEKNGTVVGFIKSLLEDEYSEHTDNEA